jgi:thiosulfate/3-mercaptopyruvate sulfurtransferase
MEYTSIVNADVVAAHCDDPGWRIVDCHYHLLNHDEGYLRYCRAHIPNAVYAHLKRDLAGPTTAHTGRHPLPEIARFKQTLGRWGIDRDTQVVAYDDAQGSFAARLWWLLRWLGHRKVAVLNGGLSQWQTQGLALNRIIPQHDPREFAGQPDMSMLVESETIVTQLPRLELTLIDVRDPERFAGLQEPIDKVAGHIPNAVNVPWKSNLAADGLFLTKSQLLNLYHQYVTSDKTDQLVFMCGSGVTACHSLVALSHAGIDGAKLYPGSWSEWITNPQHPVQIGSK